MLHKGTEGTQDVSFSVSELKHREWEDDTDLDVIGKNFCLSYIYSECTMSWYRSRLGSLHIVLRLCHQHVHYAHPSAPSSSVLHGWFMISPNRSQLVEVEVEVEQTAAIICHSCRPYMGGA
jgi:hypothetical protein